MNKLLINADETKFQFQECVIEQHFQFCKVTEPTFIISGNQLVEVHTGDYIMRNIRGDMFYMTAEQFDKEAKIVGIPPIVIQP